MKSNVTTGNRISPVWNLRCSGGGFCSRLPGIATLARETCVLMIPLRVFQCIESLGERYPTRVQVNKVTKFRAVGLRRLFRRSSLRSKVAGAVALRLLYTIRIFFVLSLHDH